MGIKLLHKGASPVSSFTKLVTPTVLFLLDREAEGREVREAYYMSQHLDKNQTGYDLPKRTQNLVQVLSFAKRMNTDVILSL